MTPPLSPAETIRKTALNLRHLAALGGDAWAIGPILCGHAADLEAVMPGLAAPGLSPTVKHHRCRHERNSWIILGGLGEWCFVCGAWRPLRIIGTNSSVSAGAWRKPSHDRNVNPYTPAKT